MVLSFLNGVKYNGIFNRKCLLREVIVLSNKEIDLSGTRYLAASLFKRLAASVYDTFVLFSLLILATALALIVNHGESLQSVQYLFLPYLIIIIGTFVTWFWQRSGQTLGMLSWKIKLLNQNGRPISWRKAWVRFVVAIPSILCFGLGWIWCLIDKNRQSLHDRICGTYVVSYKK